ncbi:MAG TPA: hypothetical protein VHT03_01540 [Rhizomicrobium sp.]|jgi:hypothetical protein|nr:hypothetical protein [Rhizomicrobium sp.]
MAQFDLCTLADVKAWLGRSDANSDAMLSTLITRVSRQILSYLCRTTILPHSVSEIRDGTGGETLVLREWPVLLVSSLAISGQSVPPASASIGCGFFLETWNGVPPGRAQVIALNGVCFTRAAQNVSILYSAGYQVSAEGQTVENGSATVNAPYGAWTSDGGVTYANGTSLTRVTGMPSVGQYQLTPNVPGSYSFNAGDNGEAVLITYGYVPADLADAAIELVGERFKYAQRIGEISHSLGGNETVAFDNARLTPLVTSLLAPYRNLLPI